MQKGQKAIALWMPITCKRTVEQGSGAPEEIRFTWFVLKRNWFVLAQTEGNVYESEPLPDWDRARALQGLGIEQIAFDHTDRNVWGFARGKQIAVSPLSPMPDRPLLHEIAHVILGHTAEHVEQDGPLTPRNIRDVEAEGVALLCSAALGLDGAEYSRGYLQHGFEVTRSPNVRASGSSRRRIRSFGRVVRPLRRRCEAAHRDSTYGGCFGVPFRRR